jgi:hypothetical protein
MTEMTVGETRVRVTFNPNNNDTVHLLKQKSAELIDLCETMRGTASAETGRLISLAQTHYEDAAMWAVKAATA